MNIRKVISLFLLSIYSVILTHDIIPHYHLTDSVDFGFHSEHQHTHSHIHNHDHIHDCDELTAVNTCSCNITHNHTHGHPEKHANCESFKVQLSKLFAFTFFFNFSFEQSFTEPKVFINNQDTPEVLNQIPIRRRGPPAISSYSI